MKIYVSQLNPTVGDLSGNTEKIIAGIEQAKKQGASIALFSELVLTGYPPDDLVLLPHFIASVGYALAEIGRSTFGITAIIGVPRINRSGLGKGLHNSAAVLSDGNLLGFQDKVLLPTYDVFDERRYFEPGGRQSLWEIDGKRIAITICEDIWHHHDLVFYDRYTEDPVKDIIMSQRPDLVLNLSASPYNVGKAPIRTLAAQLTAKTLRCPVVLCNQVGGNDSLIFDGNSVYLNAQGDELWRGAGFIEDSALLDLSSPPEKLPPSSTDVIEDLYHALVLGVSDYFSKSGFKTACLGLSGGIDSALVACIAAKALGVKNIYGVAMPSRYSSSSSIEDAKKLAENLGINFLTIPIESVFTEYLNLLTPTFEGRKQDVTEENIQSRIRGMILMALSNKFGHVVLNTGNKSELAMGYATLYGDMCGGLGVISDLTKRRVYALAGWINQKKEIIPNSTMTKEPSAELRPGQKDSDSLPPYEDLDTVVEEYLEMYRPPEQIIAKHGIKREVVEEIVRKIHLAEYKRRQAAPGLRVTPKAFSIGHRFPIVQRWVT